MTSDSSIRTVMYLTLSFIIGGTGSFISEKCVVNELRRVSCEWLYRCAFILYMKNKGELEIYRLPVN